MTAATQVPQVLLQIGTLAFERLVPLGSLVALAALFVWVLFAAQRSPNFDAADFLRDETGRLSWGRLAAMVCCVTHTWTVFTRTLSERITFDELLLYCAVWSGSLILLRALDVWRGVKLGVVPEGLTQAPSARQGEGDAPKP